MKTKEIRLLFILIVYLWIWIQPVDSRAEQALPKNPALQNLPAPKVNAYLEKTVFYENSGITLSVEIGWPAESGHYLINPPQFELPPGLQQVAVSSSSSSKEQGFLRYRFVLQSDKPGAYRVSPITVRYQAGESQPQNILEVSGVYFQVEPRTLLGIKVKYWWTIGGTFFIIIGLIVWAIKNYMGRKEAAQRSADQISSIMQKFELCQTYKRDAAYDKFFGVFMDVYQDLGETKLDNDLAHIIENIRFGGYNPSLVDVDLAYNKLEKRLNRFVKKQGLKTKA